MKKLPGISWLLFFIPILGIPADLFSQNMGIGTTVTPTRAKLEVNGVAGSGYTSGIFGDATGISLQRNWPTVGFNQYNDGVGKYMATGYAAIQYLNPVTGELAIDMLGTGTANTPVNTQIRSFTINNNGNVGIRTTAIDASLYAIKAGNYDGTAVFAGSAYASYFCYGTAEHTYIRPGFAGGYVFLNDGLGNVVFGGGNTTVGINAPDPTYTLEIRQNSSKGLIIINPDDAFHNWEQRLDLWSGGPSSRLSMRYDGNFLFSFSPVDGSFGGTSDIRVKANVHALGNMLDKVMLLKPSVYEMKDHNNSHEKTFGFIAQDVESVFPELVRVSQIKVDSANKIPDLHNLNYNAFPVIAIKALQEQYGQIRGLEIQNRELMKRLEALERKLAGSNK